jgi:hypothetical protein
MMGSEVRRHLKRKIWKKVHENKNKTKQTEKKQKKPKQNARNKNTLKKWYI